MQYTDPLEIDVTDGGDGPLVLLRGELDVHSAPELVERLADVLAGGAARLYVDVAGLAFCDSTGLGALITAYRVVDARGGRVRLLRVRGQVARLLDHTGLRPYLVGEENDGAQSVDATA